MRVSNDYLVVEQIEKEKQEGFQTVEVQDSFVYKGKIVLLPEIPVYIGNYQLAAGDVIMWAKGSPDTHEINNQKFVKITDLLAVC